MGMAVRLVGAASLVGGKLDVRVHPALVDRRHPLAAVEGAFNAVMLQGDAIREITLEGPGAGGIETASAVVADMVSVIGTTGTGFLQNDACWRELDRLEPGRLRSPFYVRLHVEDRAGVLAHVALRLATHGVSIGRLVQHQDNGSATLHIVTHEAPAGDVDAALEEIGGLEESRSAPSALPVISDRGVPGLGWA
jgi:homoserine dehydrogenase